MKGDCVGRECFFSKAYESELTPNKPVSAGNNESNPNEARRVTSPKAPAASETESEYTAFLSDSSDNTTKPIKENNSNGMSSSSNSFDASKNSTNGIATRKEAKNEKKHPVNEKNTARRARPSRNSLWPGSTESKLESAGAP